MPHRMHTPDMVAVAGLSMVTDDPLTAVTRAAYGVDANGGLDQLELLNTIHCPTVGGVHPCQFETVMTLLPLVRLAVTFE